ncbi:MAG: energy transducer TonB [Bacteroidia bacterium]
MDDFDREALEGLKLIKNEDILNKLNNEVDIIVEEEKRKKKTVYYFSIAASLLLIIGLIFLFKNLFISEEKKPMALAEKPKEEKATSSLTTPKSEEKSVQESKQPTFKKQNKTQSASKKEGYTSPPSSSLPVIANKVAYDDLRKTDQSDESKSVKENDNQIYREENQGPPQSKQEEQSIVAYETETTSNNTTSGGAGNNGAAKKTKSISSNVAQPAQGVLSNANITPATIPSANNDKEKQKDKTSVVFFAHDVDSGTTNNRSTDNFTNNKASNNYEEARFIGGDSAFAAYVKQNLKISSPINSGVIIVSLLITKNGGAEKIEVTKPLANCTVCSDDVINLIKSIKKWLPALANGKPIDALKKINIQYN